MNLTDIDFMTVEQLGDRYPLDWTSIKGLIPYIKRLKNELGVRGVEVGTCRGESAYLILDKCPNVSHLTCIDPFMGYKDWSGELTQEVMDKFEAIARENLKKFGDRVTIDKTTSEEAAKKVATASLDFVFIDGDHSFESTYNDLNMWYKKVRPQGIFAGHDFNLSTVRDALNKFREENKIRIPIQQSSNNTWFWHPL